LATRLSLAKRGTASGTRNLSRARNHGYSLAYVLTISPEGTF